MSHFSTHSLCNKLQKWMNLKSQPPVHASNSHCSHHNSHLHNNSIIMSSPYKKTNFETLLRRYPKNQDDMKFSRISYGISYENEQKENAKRSFQSRIIKYDNIKSKIDTNLANIKQSKSQGSVLQENDENQNTQNMPQSDQQTLNEKLNSQKPLTKKIKLNSEYFLKFQQQKSSHASCEDLQQMILHHNFGVRGYQEKLGNEKRLFRINVSKKINLLNKKESQNEEQQEESQMQKEQQINEYQNEDQQHQKNSPIILEHPQSLSQLQNSQLKPQEPIKLLNFESTPKLVFKELGFQAQLNREGEQYQEEKDIFTLDGYRILEDKDQLENYQIQQQHSQKHEYHQIKQTLFDQIPQHDQQSSNLPDNQQAQQQISQPSRQNALCLDNQVQLPPNNDTLPQIYSLMEKIKPYPSNSTQQKQNITQNIQAHLQKQKPKYKQQKQKLRKNSRTKKDTKILTRSKEQKLNLLNQLSMRLIRKKYGQNLSHSDLADKMLSHQSRVQLKAFIQSGSLQSQKTVFDFNELTQTQMRNTLIKYFASEENDSYPQ